MIRFQLEFGQELVPIINAMKMKNTHGMVRLFSTLNNRTFQSHRTATNGNIVGSNSKTDPLRKKRSYYSYHHPPNTVPSSSSSSSSSTKRRTISSPTSTSASPPPSSSSSSPTHTTISSLAPCILQNNIFRTMPKVPMTKYLETKELSQDMLYSGYRPIMYPVKENPLFRLTLKKNSSSSFPFSTTSSSSSEKKKPQQEQMKKHYDDEYGGIMTGGINGTWRYSPRIPNNLLPNKIWSMSIMGMEYYPEWKGVPFNIVKNLKPFDKSRGTVEVMKKPLK
ncbi:Sue1p NDAI_0B05890 [Naumovozyma dairenensis CBS 421]|uniref:Uncharacterized protein n=1 Tax=Naumovozyma dairenensis (strain ATCC 10597 / BCRC 20456 / CBS 421 / NBRC 0211 / NRRL Y-12639) TaxID=1071378 RepID=G0W760_NAUDC|nr:hypothetical protein NDAI_0B05890 [Naumovozyma dairenensis CBS 421]CCD23621.1 hypothetical protein NDAI_0B05890 [Naumovozyma dairenensis CBS 421]